MSKPKWDAVRRVVTGVDQAGKSTVVEDGDCACQSVEEQYVTQDLWMTVLPAPVDGPVNVPSVPDLDPEHGQFIWRRFSLGAGERIGFHATETVDMMTVESGEVTLILEARSVVLSQGDCVVQRGTRHGWLNEGTEPCVLIGFMASTE